MNLKGAIFDFDGVVVDTTPLHFLSWKKLLTQNYNIPFDADIYEEHVNGRRSKDVIPKLLPQINNQELEKALALKQNYYHKLISDGKLKVFSSSIRLIKKLRAQSIKTAIVSSSRSVDYVLEKAGLINLFDAIISSKDTNLGKPHPEGFLLAACYLDVAPAECVIFEDAKVGINAAKAGGFFCVGIDRKNKPHHYSLADLCVQDLNEINYEKLLALGDNA